MYKLEPHQIKFSKQVLDVLVKYNIVYLAGEVRSRKTGTVLEVCRLFKAQNVLIITKKNAIPSIESDYKNFGFTYNLLVINYESLHKIDFKPDLVIYDEAHSLGAYPKPSIRTKLAKKLFYNVPCILMSGTPSVESHSQLYHQFSVSAFSPFKEYSTFYNFYKGFEFLKFEINNGTHNSPNYKNKKTDIKWFFIEMRKQGLLTPSLIDDFERITNIKHTESINNFKSIIKPYFVKMTQADAGLETQIKEHYLTVKTPQSLINLANKLIKDRAVEGERGFILGDLPAKLQSKVHQIINGHCIIETAEGDTFTKVFSTYKANFIKHHFANKKIAIMYFYQAELEILKQTFNNITTDVNEFNDTYYNIAVQQNSTEGMNLSKADAIVYFNLGFSGKNYLQSRDRLTVKGRTSNDVYYICEDFGMTNKILEAVSDKSDFNSKLFMKWQTNNQN